MSSYEANPAWVNCRSKMVKINLAVIEGLENGPSIVQSDTGEEDTIMVDVEVN